MIRHLSLVVLAESGALPLIDDILEDIENYFIRNIAHLLPHAAERTLAALADDTAAD